MILSKFMLYKYELVNKIWGIIDLANFWSWMVTVPILKESPYNVSALGQEERYTVKYTPMSEGVSEGTPEGRGVYLTVYPE